MSLLVDDFVTFSFYFSVVDLFSCSFLCHQKYHTSFFV